MSQATFWGWFNYSSRIKNIRALTQPKEIHKLPNTIKQETMVIIITKQRK